MDRPLHLCRFRGRFLGKLKKRRLHRGRLERNDARFSSLGAHRRRRVTARRRPPCFLHGTLRQDERKVFEQRKIVPSRAKAVVSPPHFVQLVIPLEELRDLFHSDPLVGEGTQPSADVETNRLNGRPSVNPTVRPEFPQNLVIRKFRMLSDPDVNLWKSTAFRAFSCRAISSVRSMHHFCVAWVSGGTVEIVDASAMRPGAGPGESAQTTSSPSRWWYRVQAAASDGAPARPAPLTTNSSSRSRTASGVKSLSAEIRTNPSTLRSKASSIASIVSAMSVAFFPFA